MAKYKEYKQLSLTEIGREILQYWKDENVFAKSLKNREGHPPFIFYEGPPSANGIPGIHHVMARSIKDIFCRYKTLKGFYVNRKAGWDTHGLPVELGVEKNLGITKEDIGVKISVDEYNQACRSEVMKYKDLWDNLTEKMGYWVDLDHPYITFDNKYIESVWFLLQKLFEKDLLYKGYTIQPYSPAAGTGLSTHELNQPGCYRDVKDTTCVGLFKVKNVKGFSKIMDPAQTYFMAWTTTPWTLSSNVALAVGQDIEYVLVKTFNPYAGTPIHVILAKPLLHAHFPEANAALSFEDYKQGDKNIPFQVLESCMGKDLATSTYEQLFPWVNPGEGAFRVICGDFVTTEDGTGIVHIAPTFGADDDRVAKINNVPALLLVDKEGKSVPMVDRTGKYFRIEDLDPQFVAEKMNVDAYREFAGRYVKNAFDPTLTDKDETLDVALCMWLKKENKVFKIEKQTHNYPHCWRTDKPILYYPLDSWFIKTTALKDRLIALNKTIHWKPESTGTGRFGNWLENLVDWNLSRSRYWGTPLPIWVSEDGSEKLCIGSVSQLKEEVDKAVNIGFMKENPFAHFDPNNMSEANYHQFDLHRPYVDDIILQSPTGQKMFRETDLIDVWFDSGAMPYAQYHYPFETDLKGVYPADFIAEGVDQTRGWFFTLHAIAVLLFDTVAFKTVVSNGLVLDKKGNKMSKRLGNGVDPFETIDKYGPDATRWYMITNAQPWDNLKFDIDGIAEVQRKFFGTLYNTYSFFALYANIDGFSYQENDIPHEHRPEIDRWILSELNTLIKEVDMFYADYEPTKAGRAIQQFVDEHLSNWYVRLCRRRFWKGDYSEDKISAYQTLYTCLIQLAKLMAPIAPFFADRLYKDLNVVSAKEPHNSVHLSDFPVSETALVDSQLEERMQLAQKISSLALSLRKRTNIRVRQPLNKIMIPVLNPHFQQQVQAVENLILSEINVKSIDYLADTQVLVKKIKPNFKTLGPKYSKLMKQIAAAIQAFSQEQINRLEQDKHMQLNIEGEAVELMMEDVEIFTEDIPGWVVANEGLLTVALDITITDALKEEGIARELINRIQNIRKDENFEVTDKIMIQVEEHESVMGAIQNYLPYICAETLAESFETVKHIEHQHKIEVELNDTVKLFIHIKKK